MKIYKIVDTLPAITLYDYVEVRNSTPDVIVNDIHHLFTHFNYSKKELMNIEAYKEYFVTK